MLPKTKLTCVHSNPLSIVFLAESEGFYVLGEQPLMRMVVAVLWEKMFYEIVVFV